MFIKESTSYLSLIFVCVCEWESTIHTFVSMYIDVYIYVNFTLLSVLYLHPFNSNNKKRRYKDSLYEGIKTLLRYSPSIIKFQVLRTSLS